MVFFVQKSAYIVYPSTVFEESETKIINGILENETNVLMGFLAPFEQFVTVLQLSLHIHNRYTKIINDLKVHKRENF